MHPVLAAVTIAIAAIVPTVMFPTPGHADEGQWMPGQLPELADRLGPGVELRPETLWNDDDGGLLRAIVNLSGCSAGFVSRAGLIATNHHCAVGAIQSQSSEAHDYLTDGFVAGSRAEELEAKGKTVKVLVAIDDVTESVRALVAEHSDPIGRERAVDRHEKELVAECEAAHPGHHCTVASFYRGSQFQLLRYLELLDVRLVLAPPSSIGNFGGEIDNWMWPRHSGDFTLLRAYVAPDGRPAAYAPDNVPYEPARWLEVSPTGVAPGDFVAVLGYPGHTDRYLSLAETIHHVERFLPARIDLYGEWIDLYERHGARDPAVKIKVAARLRSLANRHKNARGMLDGIAKIGLLEQRRAEEDAFRRWAAAQEDGRHAGALERLDARARADGDEFAADFLVENLPQASALLDAAIDLIRWAKERRKPDIERPTRYMDRERSKVWNRIERGVRDFDADTDAATLAAWLRRHAALPPERRVTDVGPQDVAVKFRGTELASLERTRALFDAADYGALESSRDPLIAWARQLVLAIEAREERQRARKGESLELGPLYFDMVAAVRPGPVYPDANGTLRVSLARVEGYAPRDGLIATPQTTLAGQLAKYTGAGPFDLPAKLREAAAATSPWVDPGLADVPVCFLSNADTTGGNSGSPVIDGRGRWIGLNFDRVWENIAGDFGWRAERSRNIVVDIRYILWTIDRVFEARHVLEELGIAEFRAVHLNLNVRGMPPSATVAINERSNDELIASGRRSSSSGSGQSPFPVPAPVVEALRANAAREGLPAGPRAAALRNAVADYHGRRRDVDRTATTCSSGRAARSSCSCCSSSTTATS
jgi:hypothetical protein